MSNNQNQAAQAATQGASKSECVCLALGTICCPLHNPFSRRTPAATTGELPKKMSWLDAPHDIQNDHANAWSKGWNACRAAIEADRAQQAATLDAYRAQHVRLVAENADLRAQLAAKGQGYAVEVKPGEKCPCGQTREWCIANECRDATPASAQLDDPRIEAFYKLRDIAERDDNAEAASVILAAIAKAGAQPDQRESAAAAVASSRTIINPDGSSSTFISEYEAELENDLAAIRDLFPTPDFGELHNLWSEACSEPRAVVAYVKAQFEACATPPSPSTAPTAEPWGYAMVRYGKVQHIERSAEQAAKWIDAEAVPLIPMWSPSAAPATCCACEGAPSGSNNPCAVCGRSGAAPITEDERAAFEAWAKSDYENLGGEYAGPGNTGWWYWDDITAAAWDAWEARASKPPAREAAERQSIDTPMLRQLLVDYKHAESLGEQHMRITEIIAHIDTWGGAAPVQPLAYIAPHVMESLRAGCHVATVLSPVLDEKATEALYG